MASLVIMSGEQAGTYYQIANRPLTAGRDPAREIQILDAKVSRKHFQVRKVDEDFTLVEFKSLNGVVINGSKIDGQHKLQDGDQIRVGETDLIFYVSDDPERTNALHNYRVASREAREERTVVDKPPSAS